MLAAHNADPRETGGRERARAFLLDARQRMIREFAGTDQALAAAKAGGAAALTAANATIFRDRGLSSDTSILADYSVHVALETIARQGTLAPGSVRRVAVVGPGLDFTNKADGYDYYPQQTIQPFALIDALRRLGLAAADLQADDFRHQRARERPSAECGVACGIASGYVVTLPLDGQEAWTGALLGYWKQWGDRDRRRGRDHRSACRGRHRPARGRCGFALTSSRPLLLATSTSSSIGLIVSLDDQRFDLIVATNVLVYYDVFEQALAASNVAAMLRPGGVFVTNTAVLPTPPLRASAAYLRVAHTAERYDEMFWYQRDDR